MIHAERKNGVKTYERSTTPVGEYYPRGDGVIHQWQLLKPIPICTYIRVVTQTLPFSRRDGTTQNNEPKLGRLRGIHWP